MKIGQSSIDALESAVSSKVDLLSTSLPYIIPYLKVHEKQAYVVERARTLAKDSCMKEYYWNSGGDEPLEFVKNGKQ